MYAQFGETISKLSSDEPAVIFNTTNIAILLLVGATVLLPNFMGVKKDNK